MQRNNSAQRGFTSISPSARSLLLMKDISEVKDFILSHNIEEKKSDNFESAKDFFRKQGFIVEKEASVDKDKLSSLEFFIKKVPEEIRADIRNDGKLITTWRLRSDK